MVSSAAGQPALPVAVSVQLHPRRCRARVPACRSSTGTASPGRRAQSCRMSSKPQHHLPGASSHLYTTPGNGRGFGICHLPRVSSKGRISSSKGIFVRDAFRKAGQQRCASAECRVSAAGQAAAPPQCHARALVLQEPCAPRSSLLKQTPQPSRNKSCPVQGTAWLVCAFGV